MIVSLTFPHDDVLEAVKQESSLYSIRQSDKDGNPMFEYLVFDEAYLSKFRELFFNAQAQLAPVLAAYQKYLPDNDDPLERRDFSNNKDYVVPLWVPNNFPSRLIRTVEDGIFSFLKDWIMYKWLETKDPNTAAVYYLNCVGADGWGGYKALIKDSLNTRTHTLKRPGRYW